MQALNRNTHRFPPLSWEQCESISKHYEIGDFTDVRSVPGGLLHRLLRVETRGAVWALKILSRHVVDSPQGRARLERAEIVAGMAQRSGIPALCARRGQNSHFLHRSGDEWFLLYPWQDGEILPPSAASNEKCALMGGYLGALHALQIRFPDQSAPIPEAFGDGHFEGLAARGERENAVWAREVRDYLPQIIEANARAMTSQRALQQRVLPSGWVTGHLDFDQKNVLWQREEPTILDWESAKPIHPALELMGAGLSWAGQSAGNAHRDAFEAFLRGYREKNQVSPADLSTACEAVLGKWIIWLEFNLTRSLEVSIRGTNAETMCHNALFHALGATLKLQNDVPKYRDWVENAAGVAQKERKS